MESEMSSLLTFTDVCYSYGGCTEALSDINFSLQRGERVALLGLNGSGKSTLLLHTNGLLLPTSGKVEVNGIYTRSKYLNEIRKKVGMVFQNSDHQLFMPTVWDDVAFGPRNMGLTKEEVAKRVENALKMTGTEDLAGRTPFTLSGGEKKSVSIATVLSMSPELLVMDEPTSGLDHLATQNFISIMKTLPHTLLLSTHDLDLAKRLCRRAIYLVGGKIAYDGDINDFQW